MPVPESAPAREIISWAIATYGRSLAISTSFQKEGMVILDMASRVDPAIRVFTLDTGRLPEATYTMIETVRQRYGIAVERVLPDPAEVESMVAQHGLDLFRRDVASRTLCCEIRKVRPLERKLREFQAHMVGLRRAQTAERAQIAAIDTSGPVVKISPLARWTAEMVADYIAQYNVPVHPLYALGYTSIGCDPCTRAIEAGEDPRAGRWWWEQAAAKECGIHFTPDGKVARGA